ncbi:RsfA family transcriptional regulator [Lentibacillus sp. CBA3610]|uniref:RsfA family transcriptional regulator n=1 Tax=Lentibacillus sp. CBA3610 TaxID=2518176 RepID=UPI00159572F1|nr:RsfA family transcriptional regulator [Lentibacillus sp. CBA3610]QKY68949.1 RsfA family transcriptional regulator [Lentibacillus sp. CBA3610]
MNATRQDAWTKDEDILLAETVLRHIREGRTQLEAFKEVAEQLSRTSAACGFRWNASIRKQYEDAIESAKEDRKQNNRQKTMIHYDSKNMNSEDPLTDAISLLEKMRNHSPGEKQLFHYEQESIRHQLVKENEALKQQLSRYEQAWEEMGKLWAWVNEQKK